MKAFALRELPFFWRELAAGEAVRPALLVIGEIALVGVRLEEVLPGVDEEAAGAGGGIDDALAGLRVDHLHHHADDVARRAELAVGAGGVELAEQVLVEIALHVLVLRGDLHLVDGLAGLDEQARLVDLELGVSMCSPNEPVFAPSVLRKGKTFSLTCLSALSAGSWVQYDQRSSCDREERLNFLPRCLRRARHLARARRAA